MKTAVDEFCRRQLEIFEQRLSDLKSGVLKVGRIANDGRTLIDETADEIKQTEARSADLKLLLQQV